jgi:hypothetical protein
MQEGKQHIAAISRAAAHHNSGREGVSFPAVMQMYTTAGGKKISAGANYYVEDVDQTKLYVKAGAALGNHGGQIVNAGAAVVYNAANYTPYHYYADDSAGLFINDCLNLAEQITGNTKVPSNRPETRAPNTGGANGKLFGDTLVNNTIIANNHAWSENENANPNIGEAYATVPTVKPVHGEGRYHAAAVIAKDATDNITIEADSSVYHARPIFDIYDTQPPGTRVDANSKTFHEVYSATYERTRPDPLGGPDTTHQPSTGVLVHR